MIITVATPLPRLLVLLNRISSQRSFYITEGYSNAKKKKRKEEKDEGGGRHWRESKMEHKDEVRKNAKMAAGSKRGGKQDEES